MNFLSFMLFGIFCFFVYALIEVIVRFIRRCLFIKKMKKKVNDLMGEGSDDGSAVS